MTEKMDEREEALSNLRRDESPTPEQVCDCSAQQQENAHMPQTGYHDDDCAWMPFAIEGEERPTPASGGSVIDIIERATMHSCMAGTDENETEPVLRKMVAECFGRFVDLHGSNMTSEPIEDMQRWIAQLRGEE